MNGRKTAPVQAGMFVVRRVVAVIEEQEVEYLAGKVARMVMLAPRVGMHVLYEVEHHDDREGRKGGHDQGKEPDVETQTPRGVEPTREGQRADEETAPQRVLKDDATIELPVAQLGAVYVLLNGAGLEVAGHKEIGHGDEQIMPVRITPGDRRVPRPVHELMMVQIVRRNPHQGRIAVEQRQHVTERVVGPAAEERRPMIVIVGNHAAGDRQITTEGERKEDRRRPDILHHNQSDGATDPGKGSVVRGISDSHPMFCSTTTVWLSEPRADTARKPPGRRSVSSWWD